MAYMAYSDKHKRNLTSTKWRKNNPSAWKAIKDRHRKNGGQDKWNLTRRIARPLDRQAAIKKLGGVCPCGFGQDNPDDWIALEIDHIEPVRRKTTNRKAESEVIYRRILKGKTDGLQLLCANCHSKKSYYEGKSSIPAATATVDVNQQLQLPLFGIVGGIRYIKT